MASDNLLIEKQFCFLTHEMKKLAEFLWFYNPDGTQILNIDL